MMTDRTTDTPPEHTLFYTRADRRGADRAGGGRDPGSDRLSIDSPRRSDRESQPKRDRP